MYTKKYHKHRSRGLTLLDTVVGTSLMLVIFMGIAAAFRLSLDVVINNKARSGAIALAGERMEYIRSISYGSIGVVGGIPPGTIPQTETTLLNGVTYTRKTLVEYVDDPKDGLAAADSNGIISDYKVAKVDVSWKFRTSTRHIILVSRFEPPSGMEIACTPPCGNLTVKVVDANSNPLPGASISIINASTSPAINISTMTNASGTDTFIGAPAASGYAIVVTKAGYSSAQTYAVTAQNTNPNPGHLTVANGQTTIGTFAIDTVGIKTVNTWTQVLPNTWSETFANQNQISTSTNITVAGGFATLSGGSGAYASSGVFSSASIAPATLYRWKTFHASSTVPAQTTLRYYFYDAADTTLLPNSALAGNSAGFATTTMDLTSIPTTTYPTLHVHGVLTSSSTSATPSIDSYSIDYDYGPNRLPSIQFNLQGQKTIGVGPSGTVYKYSQNFSSGASASVVIPNLEWDVYTASVNGASVGYDIASSCQGPQPETFTPGAVQTTDLYFAPHTANSFLVNVRSASTGALMSGATVHLQLNPSYSATSTTDVCGQVFFGALSASTTYSLSVSASGHPTATSTQNISGTTQASITLN